MSKSQTDLFETTHRAERPSDEVVLAVRAQLTATLEKVTSARQMPWTDQMSIIREDNAFRFAKDALPKEEARELWDAFSAEMDRLYAGLQVA